ITYVNRTIGFDATSEVTNNYSIKTTLTGFAGTDNMKGTITVNSWINPYDYKTPALPTEGFIRFSAGNATADFGFVGSSYWNDGYRIEWDYSTFNPSYTGGETYVTAILTAPSGLTYKLPFKFYVYRMYAKTINSIKNGTIATNKNNNINGTGTYVSDFYDTEGTGIEIGMSKDTAYPFTIIPYTPNSYALPTSYRITFTTHGYKGLDASGKAVWESKIPTWPSQDTSSNTYNFSYVQVSMPANFNWEFRASDVTYYASIKIQAQQRLTIPVLFKATTLSSVNDIDYSTIGSSGSPSGSASLTTNGTATVNGTSKSVPVVYYGYAVVYSKSGTAIGWHKVQFSTTSSSMALPTTIGNRTVRYVLRAVVGAMVDKNGTVLTTTPATETSSWETTENINGNSVSINVVAIGDMIPTNGLTVDTRTKTIWSSR
ncbi:MAG: hypothetical protein GX891_01235, partial [Clostridiales bacterium]|nr:hypothetical protein [Clostridiales bacterium]